MMNRGSGIYERFPAWQEQIGRLCNSDSNFRGMCDDYSLVVMALAHWQARARCQAPKAQACASSSDRSKAEEFAEEYRVCLQELEDEIRSYLEDCLGPYGGDET